MPSWSNRLFHWLKIFLLKHKKKKIVELTYFTTVPKNAKNSYRNVPSGIFSCSERIFLSVCESGIVYRIFTLQPRRSAISARETVLSGSKQRKWNL